MSEPIKNRYDFVVYFDVENGLSLIHIYYSSACISRFVQTVLSVRY